MDIDEYKQIIIELTKNSTDNNYIIALYSFACNFPDSSRAKAIQDLLYHLKF